MAFNVVELAASVDGSEAAFDQRCRFGHRVEGHAVYCHNDAWDDHPRKCHRSWYSNGRITDETCAGFEANSEFKGELVQIEPPLAPCSKCKGVRRISTDRGNTETCPLCMGSGEEPAAIELTGYEQDTLESGLTHTGNHDTAGHPFVGIAENPEQKSSIEKLWGLGLVELRSISFAGNIWACLLENTMKGEAVVRANWKARKARKEQTDKPFPEQSTLVLRW